MTDPQTARRSATPFDQIRFVLCDLDGVVWLRGQALPGAPGAIERLRQSGLRVLFVTNNSMSTIEVQEQALAAIGVPAVGDVVTSAQAAASLVTAGERVLVCGGEGVIEAVEQRGASAVRDGHAEAVIVGLHHDFDYWRIQAANAAIRAGARFIATNDDATFPTPDGPIPGAGSLVAAVATASGASPVIAGKPHETMAALVRQRCGSQFSHDTALMVGDRWSTDGLFARTLGCPFALVRSGVTSPGGRIDEGDATSDVEVDVDVPDLAALVDLMLAI
jgi:HAD superfamily hydrolase (TIGR01450 family)